MPAQIHQKVDQPTDSGDASDPDTPSNRLRVDARLNRDRILAAAREAFTARGIDVPITAIARRAGVVTDPFAIGDELPGSIEACRTARAAEVVYWIPEHSALVPGDVLIADGKGGAKLCPPSWLPQKTTHRDLAASLRPLLDLPVRRILLSHGKPVVTGGGRALARALEV
ncbi:MAG: hypothetical protein ACRD0P_20945 [Stackebrandtia sp.]